MAVSTADVQNKAMYRKLTSHGVGRVFYAFSVMQVLADDPACPEQMRVRVRESSEALREFLNEIPSGGEDPKDVRLLVDSVSDQPVRTA